MKRKNMYVKSALLITSMAVSSVANSTLLSRLGGLAYYDDVADLTWLADANSVGITMNWLDADAWATGLNVAGVTGWRLPDTIQPDASCGTQGSGLSYGYNCTGSEMGGLFYNVLGGTAVFNNIQPSRYWSVTESPLDASNAWRFNMGTGAQGASSKTYNYYAWAVQSGDVSAVPVPAAIWLFGSGLLGLVGLARRKVSYI